MWSPLPLTDLARLIETSVSQMTPRQRTLWNLIRVPPAKWQQSPWGDEGGGFWVVALVGRHVLWYNDIEEGFNTSEYTTFGRIDQYYCDQAELHHAIASLFHRLDIHGGDDPPS